MCVGQPTHITTRKNTMAKQDKKLIEALKKELKHYEVYGKAKRAEEVKKVPLGKTKPPEVETIDVMSI